MLTHHPKVGKMPDGQPIDAYELSTHALAARIITLGGIITHLYTPDRTGKPGDIVLGYENANDYHNEHPYFGALIGRVGNRIGKGKFTLDGKSYSLAINNPPNTLHGGLKGYDKRNWTATVLSDGPVPSLKLTLVDPDGTEGYPGTVNVEVIYTLENNTLRITYRATTDAATPLNLTNHAYFNLKDAGASTHYGHVLQIEAPRYTPVDETLIPTGEIKDVKGTPFDFTTPRTIGAYLEQAGGFDHNYVLRDGPGELVRIATVSEPTSGRIMETWTTEPGVQFYSGNFLDGTNVGKNKVAYQKHTGFCLETQHSPDAINKPNFPNTVLRPGQTYTSTTEYRFGVK